ncbi:MAG: J domain-containing protein, partial [Alphaproteobacteria bacterium]|nr:J domain-containing protein [Alphaproteobacteria bacterium]
MKDALEYYAVLEVNHLASLDEIKLKYRDLAKHWHPDSNHASDAMEHFQKLSVAYDVLKNDDTRLMYDLLSEIYDKSSFPDMKNLSILKDKNGYENPFVRVIRLRKIRGKIISFLDEEEKLVLSYEQAKTEVLTASLGNWLLGWWHILAFLKNLQAIIANVRNIGKNQSDNLLLLVHNGIAYHQENKDNQALSSLRQALQYADEYQTGLINRFIKELHPSASVRIPVWHSGVLKIRQLIVPFLLAMIICYPLARGMGLRQYMKKENAITYFQKVKFNN